MTNVFRMYLDVFSWTRKPKTKTLQQIFLRRFFSLKNQQYKTISAKSKTEHISVITCWKISTGVLVIVLLL